MRIPITVKWRKVIEVSDDFYDFLKTYQKRKQMELDIKLSFPKTSQLLLKELKKNERV